MNLDFDSISPLFESFSEGMIVVDPQLKIIMLNSAAEKILGPGCEGFLAPSIRKSVPTAEVSKSFKQTISAVRPKYSLEGNFLPYGVFRSDSKVPYQYDQMPLQRALKGELVQDFELIIRNQHRPDGVRLLAYARSIKDDGGRVLYAICSFQDVSSAHDSEQRHNIFRQVFAQTQEAIVITDGEFVVQYANQAYWDLTGNQPEKVLNRPFAPTQEELHDGSSWRQMQEAVKKEGRWSGEFVIRRKSNELLQLWASLRSVVDSNSMITNYVLTLADLTSLKSSQEELYRLLSKDAVTGLNNRMEFFKQLDKMVQRAMRLEKGFALFCIDLQRFKELNDSLGHQSGDKLLQEIANRLTSMQKQEDILARLGGDEFAIAISDCASDLDLALAIERIRQTLETPLEISGHKITPSICIGVAVFPNDGNDASTLAKNADTALTAATTQGEADTQVFTQTMNKNIIRHFWVENNLRNSFGTKQLIPYFQPQLNLENMKPEEAEVLIRWNHPEHGLISPGEFIPVAERTGLILRVTSEIIEATCLLMKEWKSRGMPIKCVAINCSANLLLDRAFVDDLYSLLSRYELEASDMLVEITESSAMLDPDQVARVLAEMKEYGLPLAIDDFGTGYSSLAYLHKFAVDQIKIDQSFVKDLANSQESKSIIKAIVRMCETLGFETLAEGVETKEQAQILRDLGVKKLQGYLIAKPLSSSEFQDFMASNGQSFVL